jgi:hypothetical protein
MRREGDRLDQVPTAIVELLPAPPWQEPPIFT